MNLLSANTALNSRQGVWAQSVVQHTRPVASISNQKVLLLVLLLALLLVLLLATSAATTASEALRRVIDPTRAVYCHHISNHIPDTTCNTRSHTLTLSH
jgi:hypothetical protein